MFMQLLEILININESSVFCILKHQINRRTVLILMNHDISNVG